MPNKGTFWVGEPPIEQSVSEILSAYERGEHSDSTPVRILEASEPKPLRKYMRELVWMEYQSRAGSQDPGLERAIMYRTSFEKAPVGLVVADLAGRIIETNQAWRDALGYSEEELTGMGVGELCADEDRSEEIALGNEIFAGKRDSFQIERNYRHKDGHIVSTVLSVAMVRDSDGLPSQVIGQIVDVTERNELRDKLESTRKLQALGEVVGKVAHDLNNALAVITSSVEALDDPHVDHRPHTLADVRAATTGMSRLTQQLLAFNTDAAVEVEFLGLNDGIRKLLTQLKARAPHNMTLHLDLDTSSPLPVTMNEPLLETVLVNVVDNAYAARGARGGNVTLRTRRTEDNMARLEVADDGEGMNAEVKARAMEPFFSTRPEERSSGLGLTSVLGVVHRFGGSIDLESTPGQGTCCIITLPLAAPALAEVPTEKPSPKTTTRPSGPPRLLVVDDQLPLLRVLTRLLRKQEFEVQDASSVQSSLSILDEAERPFDLLVSDLLLRDGNGTEIASAARDRWPELPVLFMSGFTGDHLDQEAITGGHVDFIAKPFLPKELIARIHQILGNDGERPSLSTAS